MRENRAKVYDAGTDGISIIRTLEPIWLPHWPACRCTISLILRLF